MIYVLVYLSDQNFIDMGSIKISSVKEGDSLAESILDQRDGVLFWNSSVIHSGEAHAPISQLGNLQHNQNT